MAKKRKKTSEERKLPIPEGFITRMRSLLGEEETQLLVDAMDENPTVSIRINRRKVTDVNSFISRFAEFGPSPVPWCASGFYLDRRPDFILDPLLHAGTYYVQEAASMVYESLVGFILDRLKSLADGRPILAADLCAAPGGKSTAILNALDCNHILVANEIDRKRASILKENLDKWGDPDVIITSSDTSKFAALTDLFDLVAVDAPCSGEGMMRREPIARSQWNPGLVNQCAALQSDILKNAVAALRPGGFLIYSTCTFNDMENEGMVEELISKYDLELVPLDTIGNPRHFYPHRDRCEGLFTALFRKPEGPCNKSYAIHSPEDMVRILKKTGIYILSAGTEFTTAKGNLEIPSSRQVLATDYDRERFPSVEVNLDEARAYLRRDSLRLPEGTPLGYVAITYMGHPLGLVKNIGSRANNLYPSEWKIRS